LDELYCDSIVSGESATIKTITIIYPPTNIDPTLATPSASTPIDIPTPPSAPVPAPRAPPRNRRRAVAQQDEVEGKRTRPGETNAAMTKVLESIQQLTDTRRHVLHVAVELLEEEYEERLTKEHMDMAYDFLENIFYTIIFRVICYIRLDNMMRVPTVHLFVISQLI
jgi:hypothetical protein